MIKIFQIFAFFSITLCFAELTSTDTTLILNDGQIVRGSITSQDSNSILFVSKVGQFKILKSAVKLTGAQKDSAEKIESIKRDSINRIESTKRDSIKNLVKMQIKEFRYFLLQSSFNMKQWNSELIWGGYDPLNTYSQDEHVKIYLAVLNNLRFGIARSYRTHNGLKSEFKWNDQYAFNFVWGQQILSLLGYQIGINDFKLFSNGGRTSGGYWRNAHWPLYAGLTFGTEEYHASINGNIHIEKDYLGNYSSTREDLVSMAGFARISKSFSFVTEGNFSFLTHPDHYQTWLSGFRYHRSHFSMDLAWGYVFYSDLKGNGYYLLDANGDNVRDANGRALFAPTTYFRPIHRSNAMIYTNLSYYFGKGKN